MLEHYLAAPAVLLVRLVQAHTDLQSCHHFYHLRHIFALACRLPQRIRPATCAFGSLTDGFLPFHLEDGRTVEIHAASIVMKSVQARIPISSTVNSTAMEGSGKLGDDEDGGKAQVNLRGEQGSTCHSPTQCCAACSGRWCSANVSL